MSIENLESDNNHGDDQSKLRSLLTSVMATPAYVLDKSEDLAANHPVLTGVAVLGLFALNLATCNPREL